VNGWSEGELRRIGEAAELQLASRRSDGTLGAFTTMWVVRAGDKLYVRSAGGPERPWYRRAFSSGTGQVRAGGLEAGVTFDHPVEDGHEAIDASYHSKYDRHGPGPVSHVTGEGAQAVTIRLLRGAPSTAPTHE